MSVPRTELDQSVQAKALEGVDAGIQEWFAAYLSRMCGQLDIRHDIQQATVEHWKVAHSVAHIMPPPPKNTSCTAPLPVAHTIHLLLFIALLPSFTYPAPNRPSVPPSLRPSVRPSVPR
jgi:hypothetical protein